LNGSLRQNALRDHYYVVEDFAGGAECYAPHFSEFESVLFEFYHRPEMQFGVQICNGDNSAPPRTRIIEFICLFLQGYLPEHESLVLFRYYVNMSIDFHFTRWF